MLTALSILAGLVLLLLGGELLVRGAVQVASRLGVSPLAIGIVLVGFGTSSPELVTSLQAALSGSPGIAYGNIVGSNVANILLILGISAALSPMLVASVALKRDGLVMLAVTLGFAAIAAVWPMDQIVGAAFLVALVVYILVALRQEQAATAGHGAAYDKGVAVQGADIALVPERASRSLLLSLVISLGGLALVVLGGQLLVGGAVTLARELGVSETIIGLSLVAIGTSLPELATSIIAAIRRESDLAFGNIVGSNIYNILGIGGVTALLAPSQVPDEITGGSNFVLLAASLLVVAIAYTGMRISRREGALLLFGYAAYLIWLWVGST